jgi:DNA polymerase-3 subunit delta'
MSPATHILGHTSQQHDLLRDVEVGNIAHAYLFTGPAHIGKFTVAKWFASMLLLDGVPHDQLDQVTAEIERLLHPDLLVLDQLWMEETNEDFEQIAKFTNISQEHRKKSKAKTDTISIDDIRTLQARLHDVPRNTYRCCLIRSVERMQDEAVNALLKILEEPPVGLVFLLTAHSEDAVPATLLSRSRRMAFSRLSRKDIRPLVANVSEEDQQFLLHLAQGAPGIIEKLKNNPEALRQEQTLSSKALTFWNEQSLTGRMSSLSSLHERGEEADRFLLHLCLSLRQLPRKKQVQSARPLRDLLRGLETNVSRPLLCQKFAVNL